MTLVATAMSTGAFAQVNGYFRVINVGYAFNSLEIKGEDGGFTEGVMHVTAPTTAQPTAGSEDMITLPGTVMYIDATPMSENPETDAQYVDINPNDLIVNNLRSQAVDASAAIYTPLVENLKKYFYQGVRSTNIQQDWGFEDDEINSIIDEMFYYMQMFLEPIEDYASKDGWEADGTLYYLKSTTPNLKPLVDALTEKGIKVESDNDLWKLMMAQTMQYYQDNNMDQAAAEWDFFTKRIHLGHTYYLMGGRVTPNFKTGEQTFEAYPNGTAQISFANANKFYENMDPEIEVADMYAVWILAPVTTEKEDAEDPDTYFAVKNGVQGLDGHYYTTGYFDFPFEYNTNDVAVYGINEVFAPKEWQSTDPAGELVAYVLPQECGGKVAAHTPVVIENKTKKDLAILQPVDEPADEGDASVMKGIFFDATFDATSASGAADSDGFEYFELPLDKESTFIARENVRVFNKTDNAIHKNNPLGFFKYTGETIKANKGWINMTDIVPTQEEASQHEIMAEAANVVIVDAATFAALTDGITEIATAKSSSNVVYDIQGRIVSNPTKGLYIVNGKKVIK